MVAEVIDEIWLAASGYAGHYEVSNLGNIRSVDRVVNTKARKFMAFEVRRYPGKLLKPGVQTNGYLIVSLRSGSDEVRKTKLLHRIIAKTFIPNPDNLPQVNHKDNDPTNNRVDNLEWCTSLQNIAHGVSQLRHPHGETAGTAKLDAQDVLTIRKMAEDGLTLKQIAVHFPVHFMTISSIINRKTWKHL